MWCVFKLLHCCMYLRQLQRWKCLLLYRLCRDYGCFSYGSSMIFVLCVLFDLSVVFSKFAAGVSFGIDSIRYSRLRAGKLVSCQKTEMLSTFVLASFFILYIYVHCFSTWFSSGNRFPPHPYFFFYPSAMSLLIQLCESEGLYILPSCQ